MGMGGGSKADLGLVPSEEEKAWAREEYSHGDMWFLDRGEGGNGFLPVPWGQLGDSAAEAGQRREGSDEEIFVLMQQTWDSGKVNAKGEALDTEQRRDGEAVLAKVRNWLRRLRASGAAARASACAPPMAAERDPSELPVGWCRFSDEMGRAYYCNLVRGWCQWERPLRDAHG